jgi:hypothetical protein
MSAQSLLGSLEYVMSINALSENHIVAVHHLSRSKGYQEVRGVRVLSMISSGKHAPLGVSEIGILILVSGIHSIAIAALHVDAGATAREAVALKGLAGISRAETLEISGGFRAMISVELKGNCSKRLSRLREVHENSWV